MGRVTRQKQVIVYATDDAKEPFTDWLENLREVIGRKRILARIARLAQGDFGNCSSAGEGVSEWRLFFGPGYWVYFGEHGDDLVVLLCGGDKDSPAQDIKTAKVYWKEYLSDA